MAVGGDVIEITYNHPTLGSGTFFPKANEGNTFDPGGIRTNDDNSQIASAGEIIWQMNRTRGMVEVLVLNDQNERNDFQKIAELQSDPLPADWTMSIINGTTYAFSGKPVGDIGADINAATVPLKLAFSRATKIVG